MNVETLKKHLYKMTCEYFAGATVVWGRNKKIKPIENLVTLDLGAVSRPIQPIWGSCDGEVTASYPSATTLEINLFTKGLIRTGVKATYSPINTALNDMIDFINYVNSQKVTEWSDEVDIALLQKGDIQDLTATVNDLDWNYRSKATLDVYFTQYADGYSGLTDRTEDPSNPGNIKPWTPTPSGGGTQELVDLSTGYFTEVDIKEDE